MESFWYTLEEAKGGKSDKCKSRKSSVCWSIFYQCSSVLKRTVQYHRITEWVRLGGTTVGHLVLPPCSSRVILQHIAQDCVQIVLEYFQWGRLHTLSVPVLGHQHRKEDTPHVLVELPEHQFLPIASLSCCLAPPRAWWLSQMHWIEIHVQLQEPF